MKVLVIDDNPDHRELIIAKVRKEYPQARFTQVLRWSDLGAALRSGAPDVVLTDYRLHWSDGLLVLQAVHSAYPGTPVIMITDTGSEEVAAAGMKAGLADYVLKGHLNRLPLVVRESLDKDRLRRAHEEALKRLRISEERYRLVSEMCSDFAYASHLDPGGRETLEWMTEAFQRTLEYEPLEFDERGGWAGFVHPEDVPRALERRQKLLEGQPCTSEFRVVTKSGEIRSMHDTARPVGRVGEAIRVLGAAQDITDRRAAEQERVRRAEAESREQHYRSLAEAMPLIVWTARPDGWVDYLNQQWFEYTGMEEHASQGWGWLSAVHPDEQDQGIDAWIDAVRTARSHDIQFRLRRASDGAWRMHIGRAVPVRDASGAIVKWIGAYTDIEDERRASEALRQAQKLESVGLLAGGIAHDFNNLLTGVMGNASLAAIEVQEGNQRAAADLIQEIVLASERAADLTRQLLAYSGRGRFYVQPVQLSDLVREITILLRTTIPRKVELQLDLDASAPLVMADITQIHQLLMNLVINAGEAINEQRGGFVRVRTGVEEIGDSGPSFGYGQPPLPAGRYVFLEVEDNGCGMTAEVKSRLFEPFFSTKFTGRGLGMAAALGIVRGHQGAISVESEPGQGSRLRALFPEHAAERVSAAAPGAESDLTGHGLILVADDEDVVARFTRNALVRYGYDVLLAENGQVAFDLFRRHQREIALLFLDMTMPVMSGEETMAAIRRIDSKVPVIATSGHNEVTALDQFAGYGVAAFLQKPYSSRQLAETVKSVLEPRVERSEKRTHAGSTLME